MEEQAIVQEKQKKDSLAKARLDSINQAKADEQARLAELAAKKAEEAKQKKIEEERLAALSAAKSMRKTVYVQHNLKPMQ